MTRWHSLYLSSNTLQAITDTINSYFTRHGYQPYNPFTAFPGMSYPQTIKLFAVQLSPTWVRIIVDGDCDLERIDPLITTLSETWDCLSLQLTGNISHIHGYKLGNLSPLPIWTRPHLINEASDIEAILDVDSFNLPPLSQGQIGDIPLDGLPDNLQTMVQQVNPKDANQLFRKLSNQVLKAISKQDARTLINTQPNWDSQGGQAIRTLMQYLSIPEAWRLPDFATLRTAYTVRTHTPDGDGTMANILDYQPLYAGKQSH